MEFEATGDPLPPQMLRELWDFDDPSGSEHRLAAAAADLGRATGHRAELATQLARALGLQGRFPDADAVLDAIGEPTGVVRVRVLLERGRLRTSAGDPAAAVPLFRAAAEAAEAAGAVGLQVDALHMLAIADAGREEEWAAVALAVVDASADPEVTRWACPLHTNLGWHLHDAGRWDEALAEFHQAHVASAPGDQEQIARWAIARCLRSLGRTAEALAIQHDLAAERPSDPYVAEELGLLGGGPGS
jgi:tetratricopeptide (TPR) repeat protein